jgi:hypothetical protein
MFLRLYLDIIKIQMPSQSYNMKFRQGDFFYNSLDSTKNIELLATFPFESAAVIRWANEVSPGVNISSITNIFDPQISGIIMNPNFDFGNTFLPGNMVFNTNFNKITFDLVNPPAGSNTNKFSAINGNLVLYPNSTGPPSTLDISSGKINWSQDLTNSWDPQFDVKADVKQADIPFTDTDGGTSYITQTTNNPRCKYRKTCTLNHWHYSGACSQQIIKQPNGSTYCKCVCSGEPVFSGEPHSHCDAYELNANGSASGPTGIQNQPNNLGLLQMIKGIKMNLTGNFPKSPFGGAGGNVEMGYKNEATLLNNDAKIRELVYQYYIEVNKNIQLQKTLHNNNNKDVTMSQTMMDANVQYKSQYLNVFNIVAGIFCVSGYIYIMQV